MTARAVVDFGSVPLSESALALLILAALLIGFSKTAIGGVAMISVAICAAVLPSRASTGVVLPMLIIGDVYAVRTYHRHADWSTLRRLLPAIVIGIAVGAVFIAHVEDSTMRRTIAVIVLMLVAVHLFIQRRNTRVKAPAGMAGDPATREPSRWLAGLFGGLTGFTTMVANAGGPVMSLYLLAARFSVLEFLGTLSWLFFVVNLIKVPFAVGLGLITPSSLTLNAVLAPAVLLGAWIGTKVISYIPRGLFEALVVITTVLSALNLLR